VLEAEVKVRLTEDGVDSLHARLDALGATPLGEHLQVDTYFAHPVRDFQATDEALRLRIDGARVLITYKGPKLDPPRKTREEIEFALGTGVDAQTAATLLERLGFRAVASVRKQRTDFALGRSPGATVVSIDCVDGLGSFCEIEVPASDPAAARTVLEAELARLDLGGATPIAESYLELLLAAQRSDLRSSSAR
jgi:adenylate cyclase class 2